MMQHCLLVVITVIVHVNTVVPELVCGGNLTAHQSVERLGTADYPTPFKGNQQCIWYIRASNPPNVVALRVTNSDLYEHPNCSDENVMVYDGWTNNTRLGTWCGRNRPYFRSQSPHMMVVFTPKETNTQRKGFDAYFSEDMCGYNKEANSPPSWITSPGYPSNYASGYNCFWNLSASWGASIGVRFTDVGVSCSSDRITIYDGDPGKGYIDRSWTLCGTGSFSYLTARVMYIQLLTQTNQGKGFNFTYSEYKENVAGCGMPYAFLSFHTNRQELHSPGYPGNYFDNLSCRWLLTGSTRVRLEFTMRGLPDKGNNCGGDYITVFDGDDEMAPVLYNKLCRDVTIESSGNRMVVMFVTDGANTGPGFTMNYQGFGDIVTTTEMNPYTNNKKSGKQESSRPWLWAVVLLPTITIVGVIIFVFVYIKCTSKKDAAKAEAFRRENFITINGPSLPRRNSQECFDDLETISSNRNTTSGLSDSDNRRSVPYAAPSSSFDQFPAEGRRDDDPPPPSYWTAFHKGMIRNSDQDRPKASSENNNTYM